MSRMSRSFETFKKMKIYMATHLKGRGVLSDIKDWVKENKIVSKALKSSIA